MNVDYALLAEAAQSVNGKVYILGGGFDTIHAKQVPIAYPRLSFVLKIELEAAELGRIHKLEIQIIDEDGSYIATVSADINIPGKNPNHPKGWKQGMLSVLQFANLKFPKFGNYSFNIVVDNFSLKSIPLRVIQHVEIVA